MLKQCVFTIRMNKGTST